MIHYFFAINIGRQDFLVMEFYTGYDHTPLGECVFKPQLNP